MNIPNVELPRIVIIGVGFAGLKFAKDIDTTKYQIVVLDKNNFHTFQPLLYQVASAGLEPDSIAYPIRKILGKQSNTFFRMAEVLEIDQTKQEIKTNIGNLDYDKLVIATGAGNNFFGIDSIQASAMPMKSIVEALNLRSKILENFERAINSNDKEEQKKLMNFVVVGAGPTGVELSGALAELKNKVLPKDFPDLDLKLMRIHLIEAAPRVLNVMDKKSSANANKFLKKLGVEIHTDTQVKSYLNGCVETNSENFIADTVIWAAGVKGQMPEGIKADTIGRGNRIIVNEYCQLKDNENIYVLGDVSLIQSDLYPNGLPMLASVASQQGAYLAKMMNRIVAKKSTIPFIYKDKGSMATVGKNLAVVELKKFKFQGTFAWFVWMFVHLMLLVGFRNRVIVFVNWTWNYFKYNNGLRLIIRPFRQKTTNE
ncbi:NAD(P)/FAD-dependent oxidoreductase [Crocinitomix catalasitica]|uniref:NAD(P)/FAD-dependent oxidoreductase n=1 Tax=Crocinitomix catalasitica TaxID=184607 RepID=UPI0004819423|nr:NAD(P)/FAD-dependent oxidoreductase [Crocinitomix catalasitica]